MRFIRIFGSTITISLVLSCLQCSSARLKAEETDAITSGRSILAEDVQLLLVHDLEAPVRIAGQLSAVDVTAGERIEANYPIAQLIDVDAVHSVDSAELEVSLNEQISENTTPIDLASRRLEMTRQRRDRLEALRQRSPGSINTERIEDARFSAQEAAASLATARHEQNQAKLMVQIKRQALAMQQENLNRHTVVSPIAGTVVEVLVQPGQWVREGDGIARIADLEVLRAEAFLPADLVDDSWIGREVTFNPYTDNASEISQTTGGTIEFVSPVIQSVTGQVRVWVQIDNSKGKLRPGTRGRLMTK